mmetsp:Transcript_1618/g.2943  ORF Transcript_1618/g.2943 Transcript_1618/m.2943 type:complete len:236 (-) Transcript_1618:532-1239(-)
MNSYSAVAGVVGEAKIPFLVFFRFQILEEGPCAPLSQTFPPLRRRRPARHRPAAERAKTPSLVVRPSQIPSSPSHHSTRGDLCAFSYWIHRHHQSTCDMNFLPLIYFDRHCFHLSGRRFREKTNNDRHVHNCLWQRICMVVSSYCSLHGHHHHHHQMYWKVVHLKGCCFQFQHCPCSSFSSSPNPHLSVILPLPPSQYCSFELPPPLPTRIPAFHMPFALHLSHAFSWNLAIDHP